MIHFLRLFGQTVALAIVLALPSLSYAQTFNGQRQEMLFPSLQKQLQRCDIYRIDAARLHNFVKDNPHSAPVHIQLGEHRWALALAPNTSLFGPDYALRVLTDRGVESMQPTVCQAFKGQNLTGGGQVRLTLNQDFIYGFVEENGERYYVEPLWYYVPEAARDLFVLYNAKDVNRDIEATCAVVESEQRLQHLQNSEPPRENSEAEFQACYQLEIAIASDRSMFLKYGSAGGVANHNIGVLNNTEVDYTSNSFNHNIFFVIVAQFVSTTTNEPWTNSTDAGTLLDSFVGWGNANGFGVPHDLGELWTNRDFDAGTVGIAYVGAVCTGVKYHCLQDFTGNGELLRCMTSHEIGHNFDCDHDGGGTCPPNFIMCPFVSTSNQWSAGSIAAVNSFLVPLISGGCLSLCGGNPIPLVADFNWLPNEVCMGQIISFSNLSTGNITGQSWLFPSALPASSNQTNPSATWNTPGTFNVTLTLTGNGGPVSISKQITVQPRPTAAFNYIASGTTLFFTNNSSNSTTYNWDFGDGNISTESSPSHTYNVAGTYNVRLTAFNACGNTSQIITVTTAPAVDFTSTQTSGCAPFNVQFINLSSANVNSWFWEFPGGTPATSTDYQPDIRYSTPGTYPVTLTATNTVGSANTTQVSYVTISSRPIANFSSIINGATAFFTNNSSNAVTYNWDFGDNTNSATANPNHTYMTDGIYTVILTASSNCGTSTATQTVVIVASPVADFTVASTSGCSPLTVQFTSTASENTQSFNWQFPGGTPSSSTAQNPNITYITSGTYSATLTASNITGSNTKTQSVLIIVNPAASAAFGTNLNGATASFTNTSTNATTYIWNFGDNTTATTATPSHTYTADGTYTVVLTATNNCSTSTATRTVVIATPPTANFTAANTNGCGPLTVQFTSTASANAQTFNWQFPGGTPSSSTVASPTVIYNMPGTYSATLTATNAAGSNTSTQTSLVIVNPSPAAAFSSTVAGTTASFTNTSTNSTTYSWNFGDNTTATTATPSHTYTADGSYTVVLTATNSCGTSTATHTVVIATTPTANFTAANTTGCGPLTVQFTSTSSANAQTFNWQFPGGTPGSSTLPNPTVVYNTAGTYSATLTASNAAGSNTSTQTSLVVVNPGPTAAFSSTVAGTIASFTNTSTNSTTYSWNFGDNTTATTAAPSHTYTVDGSYTVVLTATNNCGTSTATHTVVIATAPTANFTAANTTGCGPLTVQFTSTSSANTQTFNWQFPGGTPNTSTVANPTVIYNTTGTYSATLTASNVAGSNTSTQTSLIVVNPNPAAAFSSTVVGTTASFTNTSTNSTTYSWNFGDNTTATTATPSHTYMADSNYTVVLTATNSCGTSTATHTVVIATAPTANFTAATTSACGPLTMQFTSASSANAQTFNWQFPGAIPSSSTVANPIVVYNTPGTYPVTLTVTNTVGSSSMTLADLVVINAGPNAAFSSSLTGSTASFTNTSTNATSYTWNFGDNTNSTAATPTHIYTADGSYTVTLDATNACGTNTFTQTVVVITSPSAGFTASTTTGCPALTVQFSDLSSGNTTAWNWTFPGGTPSTSTLQNPTVVYNTPGTYNVTLVASTAAGNSTFTQDEFIRVLAPPTSSFTSTNSGATFTFTNTSTNATSYQWRFGDGSTSSESNPTHTYESDSVYQVVLISTNNCGYTSFVQEVSISTAPVAAFTASINKGCAPLNVHFTNQSSSNAATFAWIFTDGNPATSSAADPSVTWDQPGTYNVLLLVSNGVGTDTASTIITVAALPAAAFTTQATGLVANFTNTSANGTTYEWKFGDGATSNELHPTHTYTSPGTYTVELTTSNSCGAATLQQTFTVTTVGATEPDWLSQFRVYPNPNSGQFMVEMHGEARQEVEFALFNVIGQLVQREVANFGTGNLTQMLDCSGLPAALYTLRVRSGKQSVFVKIVVQK